MKKNVENFRNYVAGVEEKIPLAGGKFGTVINFDNAATTPPFKSVMYKINEYIPWYSSIHRGTGFKSRYSSRLFEEGRENVADFVNADLSKNAVIFVKNATEGINKLAYRLTNDGERNVVLSTFMEHHSNDLPWRDKFKVDYIDIDEKGRLSLEDLKTKLKKYGNKTKLVAVSGCSNVTGYLNPIHEIANLAHEVGAKILVDAAQLIPHYPIDMKPNFSSDHIDYLVFSSHKMYSPFGVGVLIGPKETFESGAPELTGGGTIDIVTHDFIKWAEPPHSDEAGTPNVIGVVALSEAMDTLNKLDMNKIHEHEVRLTNYAMENLKRIPDIDIYGDTREYHDRVGIITFNMKGIDHETLANILSYEAGIAVRNGCFCAHPYLYKLLNLKESMEKYIDNPKMPRPGMVRISFGLYNNINEVKILINILSKIAKNKEHYIKKYRHISSVI